MHIIHYTRVPYVIARVYNYTLLVIDNVHLMFNIYVIYGNEGCGLETNTAQGGAECCMGLKTTARVPINHILTSKCSLHVCVLL